jgi:hypothetical protein
VEEEVRKFAEWIRSGKIEVRINIANSFIRLFTFSYNCFKINLYTKGDNQWNQNSQEE